MFLPIDPIFVNHYLSQFASSQSFLYKYTYNFIFEHSLLYAYQSGFIRGHSTVCQLLEMYHRVCQNLDERLSTILIFCDISKAFDRVWHEGLINTT
jgi:hypothetical protein